MRREIIKAVVGFCCLAVILGGLYGGLKYVIGQDKYTPKQARRTYVREKFRGVEEGTREDTWEDDPAAVAEETPPGAAITVRGRVLSQDLEPADGVTVTASVREGETVPGIAADEWTAFPPLTDVYEITLGLPARERLVGPYPVAPTAEMVRFNWVLAEPAGGLVSVRDVVAVQIGRELRISLWGEAELPDGTRVQVALSRDGRRWCGDEVQVEGKRFRGELAPEERGFPSGRYTVEVEFNPLFQDRGDAEDLVEGDEESGARAEEPGADGGAADEESRAMPRIDWSAFKTTSIVMTIYVGDPAGEEADVEKELEDYRYVVKRGEALYRSFMVLRELGLSAKGWSWRQERQAERAFPAGVPRVSAAGTLDVAVWRYWIDERFMPELETLLERIDAREVPSHVELQVQLRAYFRAVGKLLRIVSMRAYDAAGLLPDPVDLCNLALSLEDEELVVLEKLYGMRKSLAARIPAARGVR